MLAVEEMIKQAMRDKNTHALSAWRAVKTKMGVKLTEAGRGGKPITEEELTAILKKEVRERQEANEFLAKDSESFQDNAAISSILEAHLPKAMSPEETQALVKQVIDQVGAKGPQDMGKVMAGLRQTGAALDMGAASAQAKALLQG